MSRVFSLRDWRVQQVMRERGLKGKRVLGSGMLAAVFDNGPTVLKLTACDLSYFLLNGAITVNGRHFPTVTRNYGAVGDLADGTTLYLWEMERLEKIPRSGATRRLMDKVIEAVWGQMNKNTFGQRREPPAQAAALRRVSNDSSLPESIRQAFEDLSVWWSNHTQTAVDIHRQNFLMRAGSEELVIADPVANQDTLDNYFKRMRSPNLIG